VLLHALIIGLGWLLFVYSWWLVLQQPRATDTLRNLIIGAVVIMPTLTVAWVLHNVGIHRRKGPRRAGAVVPLVYDVDFNGRHIEADWAALQSQRSVIIERDGNVKRYVGGGEAGELTVHDPAAAIASTSAVPAPPQPATRIADSAAS
jgi:hypothetical protein